MKKLIAIISVLIVLIGAAIYFILPTNINWEKYTQEISAQVKAETGLTLAVQGTPVFSMKPSPVLKLGRITLGNVQGGSYPQMMTAAGADIQFDTGLLFRRQIKIKKIILSLPQMYFETLPNGKWNWQTAFFDKAGPEAKIGFDSLLITGGTAEVRADKYTPPQEWDRINAELFADSIQGPFFFEGNVGALSSSFGFSLKVEKFVFGQSPEFTLRVINAPSEATFAFTGKYGLTEADRGMMTGGLNFEIRKPEQIFMILYPNEKLSPELFQPIIGNLKLQKNAQTRTAEYSDFLFKYGSSSATGKMSVRSLSPEEASSLQAKEDEDDFGDEIVLRDPNNPSEVVTLDDTPIVKTKLAEHLLPKVVSGSFIFSRLDADPFFDNISQIASFMARTEYFSKTNDEYSFDLTFDTVNYKRDAVHQLKGHVKSAEDGLAFNDFSATLPSNAYIKGSGVLTLKKVPLLSGQASLEADNIGAVMRWLSFPVPEEIPQNLLRQFNGSVDFKLASNGMILQKIKMVLDKIKASGGISVRFGTRPAIGLAADISELDMVSYFPEKTKEHTKLHEDFTQLSVVGKIDKIFASLAFLNDMDMSVKIKADRIAWADIKAESLNADFSVTRGQMKIKELSLDKAFASSFAIQGDLSGFGGEPSFSAFSLDINAEQLSTLLKEVGLTLPGGISGQDKLRFTSKITGTPKLFDFETSADVSVLSLAASGTAREISQGDYGWNMSAKIRHENFRNFVRLFTDKYRPVLSNPGLFSFDGRILKEGSLLQVTDMKAAVGDNVFSGSFKKVEDNGVPTVTADLESKSLAPLGMLPRANIMDTASVLPIQDAAKDVWRTEGVLPEFISEVSFSKKPFDFSFLGKYDAVLSLRADNLYLNTLALSNVDSVFSVSSGKISVDLRRAVWENANIGGFINLTPEGDKLALQTAFRISQLNIPSAVFASRPVDLKDVASLTLNVNVSGSGKSTNDIFQSLAGKGTIEFENALLTGFDYKNAMAGLPSLTAATQDAYKKLVLEGATELKGFSAEAVLKDGLVTLKPVSFAAGTEESKASSITYNFLDKGLTAEFVFPLNRPEIPDAVLKVVNIPGQAGGVSQNLQEIIDKNLAIFAEQKEMEFQKIQEKQREALELQEKRQKELRDRLDRLDEKLTLFTSDLNKRIETVRPYAEKVYQTEKYNLFLKRMLNAILNLAGEINHARKETLQPAVVLGLEARAKAEVFDKESEIDSNYNSALTVGTKGLIFDMVTQSADALMYGAKMKTLHPDLELIPGLVDDIMKQQDALKEIQKKSDAETNLSQQLILVGEAEVGFEKVRELRGEIDKLVARKNERIAAEQKALQEIEAEKKRLEEEKARAAAEAAAAEEARKAAELRERQRTIYRRDGTPAATPAASSSTATLQPLTPVVEKTEPANAGEAKPAIIRRR